MSTNIWARAANAVVVAGMAFALAWASPASAQSTLTPEGTVIKNVATVTYTDTNGNAYSAAKDSVSVTVGFLAGIDVVAATALVNVASPSGPDSISFTITNLSNGPTGITLSLADSVAGLATPSSYSYNNVSYPSLAALATAVGSMAQGASIVVRVVYNEASGAGGLTDKETLTGTTVRSTTNGTTATDSDLTRIYATLNGQVAVTPDAQPLSELPNTGSGDTAYVVKFTVTNNESGSDKFALVDSTSTSNTAGLTIIKMYLCSDVNKTALTSTDSLSLAAGASADICVQYNVANNAAGSTGTIYLTATSPVSSDSGSYVITIIRASLTITKQAYLDSATAGGTPTPIPSNTAIGSSLVLPGQYIWYKMSVTTGSSAPASTVDLVDQLPSQVTYVSRIDDGGSSPAWTYTGIDTATGLIKAQLTTIPISTTRWIAVRVQIK